MKGRKTLLVAWGWVGVAAAWASPGAPLQVHEWGTFTSLQDETGHSIGGINSDDEPLPEFVHSLRSNLIAYSSQERIAEGGKGVPCIVPSANLRLETPVIYFYPPEGAQLPLKLDVHVEFRGGWLTQFYPDAVVQAPGIMARRGVQLGSATVGKLDWRGLSVGGGEAELRQTDSGVWLAPRGVGAATVTAPSILHPDQSESEKYLFYRGIANLDSPLTVIRQGDHLSIQPSAGQPGAAGEMKVNMLWFVEIRPGGDLAFRVLDQGPVYAGRPGGPLTTPSEFKGEGFASGNLRKLRESMHKALVEAGLFADEAYALLNTWEQSYFKTPGQRLFYLVPQAWTDYHLPLTISAPAQIKRVMIARTELVTPEQRRTLERIALDRNPGDPEAFRRLGRFRDALMANQAQRQERVASSDKPKDDRYRDREQVGRARDERETSTGH